MNYKETIHKEAIDILLNNGDILIPALEDEEDFSDIDEIIEEEEVYLSMEDAVVILRECNYEETDSGLWEGQKPEDAIVTKAVYSYLGDLRQECEIIFNELQESYNGYFQESINSCPEDIADKVYEEFKNNTTIKPVETKKEQIELIKRWLSLNSRAGNWAGFPLGKSYIDCRCGNGFGMPEIKDFVDFDREIAYLIPKLQGVRIEEIKIYLEVLKNEI